MINTNYNYGCLHCLIKDDIYKITIDIILIMITLNKMRNL